MRPAAALLASVGSCQICTAVIALDKQIATWGENICEPIEEAAAWSGTADDDFATRHIADQEAKLEFLTKLRDPRQHQPVAPDIVLEENEGVGRRAYDSHVGVRHRPALNHSEHHSLSHHAGRLSHGGAQQAKHPRVLAAHCQVPLSQDARQAKLEHLAPPRQPLARRAPGATDADSSTAGGSDRLPRGARPRGIFADKPPLSRCPQAERTAFFRRRGARQGTDRNVAAV